MPKLSFAANEKDMLLTEKETAEILALSVRTIQNWRVSGDGPPFIKLVSKSVRYRMGDILDWVEQCKRASTSEYGF